MNSNRITLILALGAVLAGFGGWYLTNNYIDQSVTQYKSSIDKGQRLTKIVVASRDLEAGVTINSSSATLRDMPAIYVHKNAIRSNTFDTTIAGKQLLYSLKAGDPILQAHVSLTQFNKFSDLIPEGLRAITIGVDNFSSIAGFLSPGDIIDLLVTIKDGPESRTIPLLIAVKVVATGKNLNNGLPPKEGYNNITLGVTPKDASRIIHAQSVARISIALRTEKDLNSGYNEGIDIKNLIDSKQFVPETQKLDKGFEIIRGGRS
ncbi:MAG: Flp pilus assembly protein CpaB [Gammaproteobacteria bacterium]|nr:MAG: Flp pilus assembly protein CpaB [Gammaproteobacteria bacterium]